MSCKLQIKDVATTSAKSRVDGLAAVAEPQSDPDSDGFGPRASAEEIPVPQGSPESVDGAEGSRADEGGAPESCGDSIRSGNNRGPGHHLSEPATTSRISTKYFNKRTVA